MQGGTDVWTRDVLNLGVKPDCLVAVASERLKASGGTILDETTASAFSVHPDGVSISLGDDRTPVTCRLLLDCMGHRSPIVRQLRCESHLFGIRNSVRYRNVWMIWPPEPLKIDVCF
jgi:lycopene cyclase CruP